MRHWLIEHDEESPELLAAIDEGLRSLEEKGARAVTRDELENKVRQWAGKSRRPTKPMRTWDVVAFLAQKTPAAAARIGLELVALIFLAPQMPSRGAPSGNAPAYVKSRTGVIR